MKYPTITIIVLQLLFLPVVVAGDSPEIAKIRNTYKKLPQLIEVIKGEATLTLFEGLPHQKWEPVQLKAELASKDTVKQHKFSFYKRPNKVSKADEAAIRKLCLNKVSFRPFIGFKACGGFHPDYSLHWTSGNQTVELQLCFGCSEIRGYLGDTYVYCEMTKSSLTRFEQILRLYRVQRPPKKRG